LKAERFRPTIAPRSGNDFTSIALAEDMMPKESFSVGVLVKKRRLDHPWADFSWQPVGILPAAPDVAAWTMVARETDAEIFYAGSQDVTLYSGETAHYRDNLVSGRPSLWVALRSAGEGHAVSSVCADPYEGESQAQDPDLIVEAVPMPREIAAHVQDFVERFHVEQTFVKRKRKKDIGDTSVRPAARILGLEDER
jgi:hypothetical protein